MVKEISWTEGAVGMYKIKSEGSGHGGSGSGWRVKRRASFYFLRWRNAVRSCVDLVVFDM